MQPRTLYKYLSPARIDVLQNLKIRFTQVSALNDPFESLPGATIESTDWYRSYFQRRVERELQDMHFYTRQERRAHERKRSKEFAHFLRCYTDPLYLSELSEKVQKMSNAVSGCLSLSANCTNILMWSHYSVNHTGFVVGFDANHDFFGPNVAPVVYSKIRPKINPFKHRHDGALFYTKSEDWRYEEEYRKYIDLVPAESLPNGNSFLPYDENRDSDEKAGTRLHLEAIPSDSISCVIYGWKSSQELRDAIRQALQKNSLNNVVVQQARPSLTEYKMEVSA